MSKRRSSAAVGAVSAAVGFVVTTALLHACGYHLAAWRQHQRWNSQIHPDFPDGIHRPIAPGSTGFNTHRDGSDDSAELDAPAPAGDHRQPQLTPAAAQQLQRGDPSGLQSPHLTAVIAARRAHPRWARKHRHTDYAEQGKTAELKALIQRQSGGSSMLPAAATGADEEDSKWESLLPHSAFMQARVAQKEASATKDTEREHLRTFPPPASLLRGGVPPSPASSPAEILDEAPRQHVAPSARNTTSTASRWGATRRAADEAVAEGYLVPLILHQTGPSLEAMAPAQRDFYNECHSMYEADGWIHKFWTDEEMEEFVRAEYPDLFPQWNCMKPIIRKVDTVRYLWMHAFGGVYLDMDGECLRPASSFFQGLPPGSTAWIGGYPEPFFMASTPGNSFWLFFVDKIFHTWRTSHVRDSSGPQGLQAGLVEWATGNGGPSAVRLFSMSDPRECQTIQPPGDVQLGLATWRWYIPQERLGPESTPTHEHRIGFIPNQILDVTACKGRLLKGCEKSHCHEKPEIRQSGGLFVHHCMETWGGHKPEDIHHSSS
mmetsp:Transcript_39362/g.111541  ORF Transcript_39362/g.111541 Transcript_39362/m.111541 type:complete len:546 (-) Transcript_39362:245-1882(-)